MNVLKLQFASWRLVMLGLTAMVSSVTAFAQSSNRPDPADPVTPVPAVKYQSVFSNYQSYEEQKPIPWKQVHEEVAGTSPSTEHAGHGAAAAPSQAPKAPAAKPGTVEGHGAMTMANTEASGPSAKQDVAPAGAITGTGIIRQIDKANAKVKMSHEPIAALGWPKMTMFFRLKEAALADQVKEGDKVGFYLEKTSSGYLISGFQKSMMGHDMSDMDKGGKK